MPVSFLVCSVEWEKSDQSDRGCFGLNYAKEATMSKPLVVIRIAAEADYTEEIWQSTSYGKSPI